MVSEMAQRSDTRAEIYQRKEWISSTSAMQQVNGDPYFRYQHMKQREWPNWQIAGRLQILTKLIGSNRASKVGWRYRVRGSHALMTWTGCKIEGSRDSSQGLCLKVCEAHFRRLGNRNARTDINHVTLDRGVATIICYLKRGNPQRTQDEDVVYLLLMTDNTLRQGSCARSKLAQLLT